MLYGSIIKYVKRCHKPGGGIFFSTIFKISAGDWRQSEHASTAAAKAVYERPLPEKTVGSTKKQLSVLGYARHYLETNTGQIKKGSGRCCLFMELLFYQRRISFAKLSPEVSYSTSNSSVTVAAISAKLLRVPREPGLTCLPSTSSGTYSRVWSVVAV